jgi:hypothetical protein
MGKEYQECFCPLLASTRKTNKLSPPKCDNGDALEYVKEYPSNTIGAELHNGYVRYPCRFWSKSKQSCKIVIALDIISNKK